MENRDIRFNEKKVDEAWKNEIHNNSPERNDAPSMKEDARSATDDEPSGLSGFFMSLAMQTLMCLGEIEHPQTKTKMQDLHAAKELIDLLVLLRQKTSGNRSPEEEQLIASLIPELQMKYVNLSSA